MNATIVSGFTAASLLAAAAPRLLMLMRIGIRRRERIRSLIARLPDVCATLARRIFSRRASCGSSSTKFDAARADHPSALRRNDGR